MDGVKLTENTMESDLGVPLMDLHTLNDILATNDQHIWGIIVAPLYLLLGPSVVCYHITGFQFVSHDSYLNELLDTL